MVKVCVETERRIESHNNSHRDRIVDSIRSRNRGARIDFLDRFDDRQLGAYLKHLKHTEEPRGCAWVRPTGVPGVVCRESRV